MNPMDGITTPEELKTAVWKKSARSNGNGGECVEVAKLSGGYGVRNSRYPDGAYLFFTPKEWAAFEDGVSKNEFG